MFYLFLFFFMVLFLVSMFLFFMIYRYKHLSSCDNGSLHEVVLHETLKVKIGKLIGLLNLKKSGKLSIRLDDSAIVLILEVIGANVSVDLLAHGSASELSASGLAEKRSELVADASGLHETRGGAVTRALLLGRLLCGLDLTGNRLLKSLVIRLKGGKNAEHLLELGTELVHLGNNRKLSRLGNSLIYQRNISGGSGDNRGGHNIGNLCCLLGSGLLGGNLLGRGSGSGSSSGSNNSLRRTNHF